MRQARGIAAAALGALLALLTSTAAWALCYQSTTCSKYVNGVCIERGGPTLCPNSTATPAAAPPISSYGAIAYGRTSGAWGTSYHFGSEEEADLKAKENSAQHGDDCKAIVYFKDGCGAVVAAGDTTVFWGLGHSDEQARTDAQNKCVEGGGKNCEVKTSVCSK